MRNRYAVVLWVAALLPCVAKPAIAQQATESAQPAPTWTIDQAVTCSVHDAWVLGGKTEQGFFRHRQSRGGAFRAKARPCSSRSRDNWP